ncbi:MAG TPA: hypothetical protein VF572_02240 [Candidatus Saccharimonadales bacterium]|jgi:hypothetical protein
MTESQPSKRFLTPGRLRAIGILAVPTAALAAVTAFKPAGIDPLGDLQGLQPACEVTAPDHKVSRSLILAGLMNHDTDSSFAESIQIRAADGELSTITTQQVIEDTDEPADILKPGETMIVPGIREEACATVNSLVPNLPAAGR